MQKITSTTQFQDTKHDLETRLEQLKQPTVGLDETQRFELRVRLQTQLEVLNALQPLIDSMSVTDFVRTLHSEEFEFVDDLDTSEKIGPDDGDELG